MARGRKSFHPTIAWREAHKHRDKLQGKPYGGIEPASQVLARGLSKWPPTKAWFPWVMAVFWLMRHEPPNDSDMPRVNDYRTTAARRIRDRKAAQGVGPWSYPRAQALAERFNWPST